MILKAIHKNKDRGHNSLRIFEERRWFRFYQWYKFFGGKGKMEQYIREVLNDSITLQNDIVSAIKDILLRGENKEILKTVDLSFMDRIVEATSSDAFVKWVEFGKDTFKLPETSLRMIGESSYIVPIQNTVIRKVKDYNDKILAYNHKRNRIYIVLYRLPKLKEMPQAIDSTISITSIIAELATVTKEGEPIESEELKHDALPKLKFKPIKKT